MSTARRARSAPAVELTVTGSIARLTLARPKTQNRLDAEMMSGLAAACGEAEHADAVRVVVLTARGPVFCAGLPRGCRWPDAAWPDGVGAVAGLTKPTVAAVRGEAVGWGFALALACDLRVATSDAVLALPELAAGALPGGGAMARLARAVGTARALELVLTGARLSAATAAAWGLVSTVVAARRLDAAAARLAAKIAARGPLALGLAKEAVVRALDLSLADGIRLEQDLYVLLQTTADREEGIRAFLSRRVPRFGGR